MSHEKVELLNHYHRVRKASEDMCRCVEPEECRIQPCPEVSPPWWNLAHTSWFFVRNVLDNFGGKRVKEDRIYDYELNSYYVALGPRLARDHRGIVSRPTMHEVYAYRQSVDARIDELISKMDARKLKKCAPILFLGLQHEQQHQELFYSEIKHITYQNPPLIRVGYKPQVLPMEKTHAVPSKFLRFRGGVVSIGNQEGSWGWDNEYPVHKVYLDNYELQNRLVTNKEYLEFIDDGGYEQTLLWLDNGWRLKNELHWEAPLYWEKAHGEWHVWTLNGLQKLDPNEPVCHVSFYEAEAYATWRNARLPTESEWEHAARVSKLKPAKGNFLDTGKLHPEHAQKGTGLQQMLGDVWEWTETYYQAYHGYKPFSGALAEYNEKFMDNQRVLRGGSCVSEREHLRISYRNFWPAETRFQFSGIRLARDV
jgi:ergothioneine biosynthesis protein EgtB